MADFAFRECKSSSTAGELATGRDTLDYGGLECLAWDFSEGKTSIDLINRREGCGFQGFEQDETLWRAQLVQSTANLLQLNVSWDFESPSACGVCLNDFSVQAGAINASSDLRLSVKTRSCSVDCEWTEDAVVIDLSESLSGIRCRYVDWNTSGSSVRTYRGKLGGPSEDGNCDASLVAREIDGFSRCLRACDSNQECEAVLATCVDGACQLIDPW